MTSETHEFDYGRFEKVACPKGAVNIPAPTDDDQQWAIDRYHEYLDAKKQDKDHSARRLS